MSTNFSIFYSAKRNYPFFLVLLGAWLLMVNRPACAQKLPKPLPPLSVGAKGKLLYIPDTLGNRIPDFSYAGYEAGEQSIPNVPVRILVPVSKEDATLRIQAALDYVAGLPADKHGLRGAVLLQKGVYTLSGQLKITASGVVLRGSGMGPGGTVLLGSGKDRETLIKVAGKKDRVTQNEVKIVDAYVPVNATKFSVVAAHSFKPGDFVLIHRPSTKSWIDKLGTNHFGGGITALGWKPGERDINWDRKIIAVEGNAIVLDAPLTTALDTTYGGGTVSVYTWPGRISQVGIENLSCQSTYDESNPKDEAHRWMALTMENVMDAWVRQVRFEHFAGSAVALLETAKRITVEDCKSLAPVSEVGGQRRYTFFTMGQQTLFQRCYAENGYHDFAVGFCAPGPNAFVQCQSVLPYNFSGTVDSWASGVLFDIVNVDGNALRFGNRGQDGQGAGWSAANSVFWQCSASRIDCYKPPTANNYAFGSWAQFAGDGYWGNSNEHVQPRSLYYAQLAERVGETVLNRAQLLPVESEASSSPSVAVAAALTAKSLTPPPVLSDWIDASAQRNPIFIQTKAVKIQPVVTASHEAKKASPMQIRNGWLVRGDAIVTGSRREVPWWSGSILPNDLPKSKPHITRFVPGRTGLGLTDDLDELTDTMKANHILAIEHNYALWYERRRDDHERVRRMDGDVWPPFYELPFARSGQGTAWDGLSKYDLTKYNPWYWNRLKKFANLADEKGLVLVHQNYMQHNILEAGAHYADFPWRTANNINHTGFPEPVPYAGDKRQFMAEQFYDLSNATRKKIHTAYIRKCLDNFKGNTGVIQLISAEYTGPLHFTQFWLDVIRDWEKETGKKEIIGLSTTKDVQDALLADPVRSQTIDLIDIRYWHYQQDGSTYEPKGGQNLAPRQHARLLKPKRTSFEQVYRAVREYRHKNPGKAVVYSGDSYDQFGWAAFMAGGSMAVIPEIAIPGFMKAVSKMQPVDVPGNVKGQWMLAGKEGGCLIYISSDTDVSLDRIQLKGLQKATWVNLADGKELKTETIESGSRQLKKPINTPVLLWLHL